VNNVSGRAVPAGNVSASGTELKLKKLNCRSYLSFQLTPSRAKLGAAYRPCATGKSFSRTQMKANAERSMPIGLDSVAAAWQFSREWKCPTRVGSFITALLPPVSRIKTST
jgi:hypothetical protein